VLQDVIDGYLMLKSTPGFNPEKFGWLLERIFPPWHKEQLPSQLRACMHVRWCVVLVNWCYI